MWFSPSLVFKVEIFILNRPHLSSSFSAYCYIIYLGIYYIFVQPLSRYLHSSFIQRLNKYIINRILLQICFIEWTWFIKGLQYSLSFSLKNLEFHSLPRTQERLDFLISIHFPDSSSLCSIVRRSSFAKIRKQDNFRLLSKRSTQ